MAVTAVPGAGGTARLPFNLSETQLRTFCQSLQVCGWFESM